MVQKSRPCNNSIHGVEYLWDGKSRPIERIFWMIVIVAAIGACATMYAKLTERHHRQVLNTVVETSQLPIYRIHFPSVAVCPWNHVNWFRYKPAEAKFLPPSPDNTSKELFYKLLSVMDALYDLAKYVSFRCDELFVSCVFDETAYDCCKVFVSERTERGFCLVFNSLISDESRMKRLTDSYYPWKIRTSGEGSGLTFALRHNSNFHKPAGEIKFAFSILIKEPEEWSDSLFHFAMPNTHNYLSITPIITETEENTRSINPQKRRCLFADEDSRQYGRIDKLPFNKLNCLVHCQQKFVIKHCNCTASMFFPKNRKYNFWNSRQFKFKIIVIDKAAYRDCKVSDLPCLYHHRDVFNYMKGPLQDQYIKDSRRGMTCDCIDNCRSMIFLVSPNSSPLPNHNNSMPEVKVDIYIGRNVMTKYGARLDYTTMDLVANFGGVLGLCLGASILSMLEIYYILMKVIVIWLVSKFKTRRRRRKIIIIETVNAVRKY